TDGCIVYANPKFERMFGYELGELTGKHVSILNYPDDDAGGREVAKQILEQIYCNGEYTYEVHNLKKDGTDFWCRATTSLLEHPDYGAVYVAVQADITLEKQARTDICLLQNLALSISEAEDFEAALALILGEVGKTYGWAYGEAWIPDQSQNILRCSPAHYMGSRKQLGHLSLTSLKHFRESTKTFTFASGAGLPGRVWTSRQPEWIVDTAKQPETTFLRQSIAMDFGIGAALGVPIVARGEVLAILIFFKVETAQVDQHLMDNIFAVAAQLNMLMQRKRLEEALFREKELAQVTLQSIGDAVITTDAQGRIQYLNPIAQALTGWSSDAEGLHIRKILAIFNEVTRLPASNPVELALQQEKTVGLESNTVLINRFGDEIAIDDSAAPIRSRDGCVIGAVMVFRDVSQTRTLSKELTWQASHDPLTQLLNRREFGNRLEAAVKSAQHEDHCHVLCYFDLDRFKIVNDTCGHTAGDELLKKVTALFEKHTRKSDTLARLGGDEFALLMHRCSVEPALRVINVLREEVNRFRFTCEGKTFGIGISVGVVLIDADCHDSISVMGCADTACYEAKRQGRNRSYLYKPDDAELQQQRGQLQWVNRLTQALEGDQFCLYYQSIVSVANAGEEAEHCEVLIRLKDEAGHLVPPGAFLPAAERYNLMHLIDRWVIQNVFITQGDRCRRHWEESQGKLTGYLYAINLSGASINDDRFVDFVKEQLTLHRIPPQTICFEITETVAILNLSKAAQLMAELRSLGCCFALDDFGSGMSSFGYLKNLPLDYVKIDGGFVKDMTNDPVDAAVVAAIHQVSQVIGLQTIAEFVENAETLDRLKLLGVDYAQGYGIARPRLLERS
ncbi:MAG: EAL domain-containing protein, partial [Nodosilinea sp.]